MNRQKSRGRKKHVKTDKPNSASEMLAKLNLGPCVSLNKTHYYSATVPVTFSGLPSYIDKIWSTMQANDTHGYVKELYTAESKAVFTKGALMLAEAKVCTRYYSVGHREYSFEEFCQLKCMSGRLPFPLALYLNCLGKTNDYSQGVTPVLAEHADNAKWSAALSWAPKQLPPLLALLREGVSVDSPDYAAAGWLRGLPNIEWEEYRAPPAPPALEGAPCVRLTEHSFNFWTTNVGTAEEPLYDLRWTNDDKILFQEIIRSLSCVDFDLSDVKGSRAQFVQTSEWQVDTDTKQTMNIWFANTNVEDYSIKLGAAFRFGKTELNTNKSPFTGSLATAHIRGELSPWHIIGHILAEWQPQNHESNPEMDRQRTLEAISRVHLQKYSPPVTVPVTFSGLPSYIDRIWTILKLYRTYNSSHNEYYSQDDKAVFIKGALMLAEAKVNYAQIKSYLPPDEFLTARRYSAQDLKNLRDMANGLIFPLALYLDCLGNTNDYSQGVTPVLAEHPDNAKWSAALSWAPKQLPPLLALLREGVSVDSPDYAAAGWLRGLPNIEWEEYRAPPAPPALEGAPCVRLTEHSFNFWTTNVGTAEEPRYDLRWSCDDRILFGDIVGSVRNRTDLVKVDLSHGKGSKAQFVQAPEWQPYESHWFVNTKIDDESIKLGVAFGFGKMVQTANKSRFTGSPKTAYMRGYLDPMQVIDSMLREWSKNFVQDTDSDSSD